MQTVSAPSCQDGGVVCTHVTSQTAVEPAVAKAGCLLRSLCQPHPDTHSGKLSGMEGEAALTFAICTQHPLPDTVPPAFCPTQSSPHPYPVWSDCAEDPGNPKPPSRRSRGQARGEQRKALFVIEDFLLERCG